MIRRVTGDDWQLLRSLRLTALAESPGSFGSTLAEEERYDESAWRTWPGAAAVFAAEVAGEAVGLAVGVGTAEPDERRLISLWVDPRFRRHGAGAALVSHVGRWAAGEGASRLSLWVSRTNLPARELYLSHGFTLEGTPRPLPSDPDLLEDRLVRVLVSGERET